MYFKILEDGTCQPVLESSTKYKKSLREKIFGVRRKQTNYVNLHEVEAEYRDLDDKRIGSVTFVGKMVGNIPITAYDRLRTMIKNFKNEGIVAVSGEDGKDVYKAFHLLKEVVVIRHENKYVIHPTEPYKYY